MIWCCPHRLGPAAHLSLNTVSIKVDFFFFFFGGNPKIMNPSVAVTFKNLHIQPQPSSTEKTQRCFLKFQPQKCSHALSRVLLSCGSCNKETSRAELGLQRSCAEYPFAPPHPPPPLFKIPQHIEVQSGGGANFNVFK